MVPRTWIDDFLRQKKLAFVGVSRSRGQFGNSAVRALRQAGHEVFPVHPELETIDGVRCVRRLFDLPCPVGGLVAMVAPERSEALVREAALARIPRIWFQQTSSSDDALRACELHGIRAVHGECLLMFLPGTAFPHRVHRFINGVIGRLPQ